MIGCDFRRGKPEDGVELLPVHRNAILVLAKDKYPQDVLVSWAHGLTPGGYAKAMIEEYFEVAVHDGKIVGFCSTKHNEVLGLFVSPDYARQGMGRALLQRAMERLKLEHSALKLISSLASVDFYRKNGWQKISYRTQSTRGKIPMRVVDMIYP